MSLQLSFMNLDVLTANTHHLQSEFWCFSTIFLPLPTLGWEMPQSFCCVLLALTLTVLVIE